MSDPKPRPPFDDPGSQSITGSLLCSRDGISWRLCYRSSQFDIAPCKSLNSATIMQVLTNRWIRVPARRKVWYRCRKAKPLMVPRPACDDAIGLEEEMIVIARSQSDCKGHGETSRWTLHVRCGEGVESC